LIGRSVKRSAGRAGEDGLVEEGDVDMPSVKSEEASDNGSDEDRDDKKTWAYM